MASRVPRASWEISLIYFQMFSLQSWMMAADLFLELASLACRISSARQAVLLEFTLHLQAQVSSRIYQSCQTLSPCWAFTAYRIHLTISSQRSVCSATFARLRASLLIYYYYLLNFSRFGSTKVPLGSFSCILNGFLDRNYFDLLSPRPCRTVSVIVIQMQCQNRRCQLALETLKELLEEERKLAEQERKAHCQEMRQFEEQLRVFSTAKERQITELRGIADQLKTKADKYKGRCCGLNDKVKEQFQTLKGLQKRLLAAEEGGRRARQAWEQQKVERRELGEMVELQERQNKELQVRVRRLEEEVEDYEREAAEQRSTLAQIGNLESVSQEQYERQTFLLREKLQLEFSRSTQQLLTTLSSVPPKEKQQEVQLFSVAEQELQLLSNIVDYGPSYTPSQDEQLTLPPARLLLANWQSLVAANLQLSAQNAQLQALTQSLEAARQALSEEMNEKLEHLQRLFVEDRPSRQEIGIQTGQNQQYDQLLTANGFYRIKLIQLQHILALLTHLVARLLRLQHYSQSKIAYFRKVASTHQPPLCAQIEKKCVQTEKMCALIPGKKYVQTAGKRFKSVALSILFIQLLAKKRKLSKTIALKHLEGSFLNCPSHERVLLKCLKQWENYSRKNPVQEKLLKEKANTSPQAASQTVLKLIGEETAGISLENCPDQCCLIFEKYPF